LLTSQSESLIAAKEFPEISRKIPVRAASNHDFTANKNHLAFEAAYARNRSTATHGACELVLMEVNISFYPAK
jgi:hypothetical protein